MKKKKKPTKSIMYMVILNEMHSTEVVAGISPSPTLMAQL
jgi:hypothetical protein